MEKHLEQYLGRNYSSFRWENACPRKARSHPLRVSGIVGDDEVQGRRETASQASPRPEHPAGPAWGGVSSGAGGGRAVPRRHRGPGQPCGRRSHAAMASGPGLARGSRPAPASGALGTLRPQVRAAAEPPSPVGGAGVRGARPQGRLALSRVRVPPSQPPAGENLVGELSVAPRGM